MKLVVHWALAIMLQNFLLPSETLHIVHFCTITSELKRMIRNAAEYPTDQDPRQLKDLTRRQEICEEVLTARQYATMNWTNNCEDTIPEADVNLVNYNFQRHQSRSLKTLPFDQKVAYYKNHGRWEYRTLPLIQCLNTEEKKLFVGFDQDDERAYLIERKEWHQKMIFRWVALIEEGGRRNDIFSGPKMQERLFKHFLEQIKADAEQEEEWEWSVCDLSLNEHGRLCSAISEGLGPRFAPLERRDYNYVNTGRKRCLKKEITVADEETVSVWVIQCSINRNCQMPQFYVVNDLQVAGAAYVLKRDPNNLSRVKIITRMAYIKVLHEFEPQ